MRGSVENTPSIHKKAKNSLIELLRFLCAFVVVNGHGYFPWRGKYFSSGTLIVEFFFVLSGFFFLNSYKKEENSPFFKGSLHFLWKRLKSLGLVFLVGVAFAIARFILVKGVDAGLFGYLWYVPQMFIGYVVFILLRKITHKREKWFFIACAIISVVFIALRFSVYALNSWGIIRMLSSMPLGVALSKLPPIRHKKTLYKNIFIAVGFVVALAGALLFAGILPRFWYNQLFLTALFYPALIYFAAQITFSNRICDYLGSLSFGLYSFQCVLRFIEECGFTNVYVLFFLLIALCVVSTPNAFRKLFSKNA